MEICEQKWVGYMGKVAQWKDCENVHVMSANITPKSSLPSVDSMVEITITASARFLAAVWLPKSHYLNQWKY
jgi:hypothetical protein